MLIVPQVDLQIINMYHDECAHSELIPIMVRQQKKSGLVGGGVPGSKCRQASFSPSRACFPGPPATLSTYWNNAKLHKSLQDVDNQLDEAIHWSLLRFRDEALS